MTGLIIAIILGLCLGACSLAGASKVDADQGDGGYTVGTESSSTEILGFRGHGSSDNSAMALRAGAEGQAPPLCQEDFFDAVESHTLDAFLSRYEGPICDGKTSLLVTSAPSGSSLTVLGDFNGWSSATALSLVEHTSAKGIFYGLLPAPAPDDCLEYKLQWDGVWRNDSENRYFAFGGYGKNDAVYGASRGRLVEVEDVYSPTLGNSRSLYVYLPPEYFQNDGRRFPVLYMQDGFNIFSNPAAPYGAWALESTLEREVSAQRIEPTIVVGIDTTDRLSEYTYGYYAEGAPEPRLPDYAAFLKDTVIPLIDTRFRTVASPKGRAVGGASLGGSSALWLGLTLPSVFGGCAALSGSFWIGEDNETAAMRELICTGEFAGRPETVRVYLDSGSVSSDGETGYRGDSWVYTDWTRNALVRAGWTTPALYGADGERLSTWVDLAPQTASTDVPRHEWHPDALLDEKTPPSNLVSLVALGPKHHEDAWALRAPAMLRFLLGRSGAAVS